MKPIILADNMDGWMTFRIVCFTPCSSSFKTKHANKCYTKLNFAIQFCNTKPNPINQVYDYEMIQVMHENGRKQRNYSYRKERDNDLHSGFTFSFYVLYFLFSI